MRTGTRSRWAAMILATTLTTPITAAPALPEAPAAPERSEPGASAAVVWPVPGGVVRGFDAAAGPYGRGHRGVDLAAGPVDEVRVVMAGTVAFAGPVARQGWVSVDHGGGLRTTYGVLGELLVGGGDLVGAGDVLGRLAVGRSHLDWGARLDGRYVDPLALLGRWEVHLVDPERLDDPIPVPAADGDLPVWPAQGPVTSGFGLRTHPITGQRRLHAGVDVSAPSGAAIVAAGAGVVVRAGPAGGYGNLVEIDHGGGLTTRYAHAAELLVGPGTRVAPGTLIARVGSTGLSTGPHLHYEVRNNGAPRDPLGSR